MKITFLTTKPISLSSGSEVRNFYLLQALINSKLIDTVNVIYVPLHVCETNISVSSKKVVTKVLTLKKRTFKRSLLSFIKGNIPYIDYLKQNDFEKKIHELTKDSDILFLSELDSYFVVEKFLKFNSELPKIILDCHNVDYIRFNSEIRYSNLIKRILGISLTYKLKQLEINAIQRVDKVFCCSLIDRKYFSQYVDLKKISVIPNGVKIEENKIKKINAINSHSIFFMGLLSYPPNDQALKYYFSNIYPFVKKQILNVETIIVGKNAPHWLEVLSQKDKSIKLLGFVNEVEPYIQKADVCICPIQQGSGTRLKILEYMAAGKAVVSTSTGSEGLNVLDGENILIADTPLDFAHSIIKLLLNSRLALRIGQNSRHLVRREYSWDLISDKFIKAITKEM